MTKYMCICAAWIIYSSVLSTTTVCNTTLNAIHNDSKPVTSSGEPRTSSDIMLTLAVSQTLLSSYTANIMPSKTTHQVNSVIKPSSTQPSVHLLPSSLTHVNSFKTTSTSGTYSPSTTYLSKPTSAITSIHTTKALVPSKVSTTSMLTSSPLNPTAHTSETNSVKSAVVTSKPTSTMSSNLKPTTTLTTILSVTTSVQTTPRLVTSTKIITVTQTQGRSSNFATSTNQPPVAPSSTVLATSPDGHGSTVTSSLQPSTETHLTGTTPSTVGVSEQVPEVTSSKISHEDYGLAKKNIKYVALGAAWAFIFIVFVIITIIVRRRHRAKKNRFVLDDKDPETMAASFHMKGAEDLVLGESSKTERDSTIKNPVFTDPVPDDPLKT